MTKRKSVNIGSIIKRYLSEHDVNLTRFSEKIGTTRTTLYRVLNSESIHTSQLEKISQVLNHDFFQYFKPLEEDSLPVVLEPRVKYHRKKKERAKMTIQIELTDDENPQAQSQFIQELEKFTKLYNEGKV